MMRKMLPALMLLAATFLTTGLLAQSQSEKTVTINQIYTDENGEKQVETTVLTGADAEHFEGRLEMDGMKLDLENLGNQLERFSEGLEDRLEHIDFDIKMDIDELKDIKVLNFNRNEQSWESFLEANPELEEKMELDYNGNRRTIIIAGDELLDVEDMEIILGFDRWGKGQIQIANENHTFMGVGPDYSVKMDKGVLIGSVSPNSGSEKAGLEEGDIITHYNGLVVNGFKELTAQIHNNKPGDVVMIQYIRNGEKRSAKVTMGQRANPLYDSYTTAGLSLNEEERCFREVERAYIGVMITKSCGENRVRITKVNRADALLQAEDIITHLGKEEIHDVNQLINAVKLYKPGQKVRVRYLRNGEEGEVKMRLLGRMVKEYVDCDNQDMQITSNTADGEGEKDVIKSDLGDGLLDLQSFNLYPNPSHGRFQLEFTSEDKSPVSIIVNNAMGKEVFRDEINAFGGEYEGEFNLSKEAPGVYFLNVLQNSQVRTEKLIIH